MRGQWFASAVRAVTRRPLVALVAVGVLALGGAALALRLEPSAGTATLVSPSSETSRETERFKRDFGDDAVVVLVKGDLRRTILTADLGRVIRLEGCLSGNVPARAAAALPPACRELRELRPAKVVFGPGTFINTSTNRILEGFTARQRNAAREEARVGRAARRASAKLGDPPAVQRRKELGARTLARQRFTQEVLQGALRYGITRVPSIDDPGFVSQLVFTPARGRAARTGVPKARFAALFPSPNAALVQVRLRPELTEGERERAIDLIRDATAERSLQPRNGASYVVTGVPVVVEDLADELRGAIFVLLGAALVLMAGTLALVFRSRLPLLPLALALAAAAMTFGALSLAGGELTMASIAVLPVLIGLAVDYAIQFQARHDEVRETEALDGARAAQRAAGAGGPTIAAAGLATAAGFLVLLLSPVPMVRGFGALIVLGIVLALACALTAGFAALVRYGSPARRPADLPPALPRLRGRARELRAAAAGSRAGAAAQGLSHRIRVRGERRARRALTAAVDRPQRVLAIGLAVAIVGWALDTQSDVVSDVRELVPRDLQALKDVNSLQEETGVSGEIDVTVRADDVTSPEVVRWMTEFQSATLKDAGFEEGDTCRQRKDPPALCPALSLPDLLRSTDIRDQRQVRGLLEQVPRYLSQGVVTADRRVANIAFGIRLGSLEDQKEVVDRIEERLDPPAGVSASVVGLPVLAAEANAALSSPLRRALTLLAALAAVFLVLFALGRHRRRRTRTREAAVPLIPIAFATGWSGGLLFLLGLPPGPLSVELNPMSITLGALVIAISTEFSVLLAARYRLEREAGASPARAVELTYASTGAAVLASGATAIAGFAALAASDIRMLRDFGILTVVDLSVSLLGVMVVLPAALVWAERHGPFGLRDLDPRPFLRELADALREAAPARLRLPRLRRPRVSASLPRRRRDA